MLNKIMNSLDTKQKNVGLCLVKKASESGVTAPLSALTFATTFTSVSVVTESYGEQRRHPP
jgi:hypothetical protein